MLTLVLIAAIVALAFLLLVAGPLFMRWRLRRQIRVIVRGLRKPEDAA